MISCEHFYVTGQVQGVCYRAYTQQKASMLGLTGWVKNLSDGRVEAVICGEKHKLEYMHQFMVQGSPASQVANVEYEAVPYQHFDHFEVL